MNARHVVLLLLLAPGLATARNFTPVAGEGQTLEYENGQPFILIERPGFAVAIAFEPDGRRRGWVNLGVLNRSEAPLLVSDDAISASQGARRLRVLGYEDLLKRQKRREMWATIGTALLAGMNSYSASQAGHTSYSGTYQGSSASTLYGNGGTTYASGTNSGYYSGSYYDAEAAARAQAEADQQNRELIEQTLANAEYQRASLAARALQATTLGQDESVMGGVMVVLPGKRRGGAEFTVNIRIGDQQEQVTFTESID